MQNSLESISGRILAIDSLISLGGFHQLISAFYGVP